MGKNIKFSVITSLILTQSIYANKLDTLTVTAQKTEQNIQDVPISMTVFNEYDIEEKRIKSVKDIAQYTPNLMFIDLNGGGSVLSPTSRGLNTEDGSFSTSIGMFIDGIPMLGTSGFDAALTDIQRIEVLKGPQGTLYGKGTHAGVINIITKKPDNETKTKLGVELGSDNKKEYTFSVSGPIQKDKFYIGLSAKHYEKDGFIKNTKSGGYTNDRKHNFGKINLRYTPNENLDISLISSKLKYDNGGMSFNNKNAPRQNSSDKGFSKPETTLHALKLEYDLNKYKLESITTQKTVKDKWYRDYDFSSFVMNHILVDNKSKNYSQELRLSSSLKQLDWVTGLNIDKDKHNSYYLRKPSNYSEISKIDGDSYGAFIHGDYSFNNKISFISGIRYDKNKLDYEEKTSLTNLSSSYSEVSPKIGLEYNLNKDSMFYLSASKGYRPGGFYSYATNGYPKIYDKETLWNYEIGSKNSFFDNKLTLNGAIYYMDIDDMQVDIYISNYLNYKSNAAKATSKGFEFDLSYQATDTLELFTSFGYNSTKFDKYKDSNGDYSGNYNPYAPKYNYNLGLQYRNMTGNYARFDLNGYGKTYLDRENNYIRKAYNLLNMKIGHESNDYDIYLYANNLFNKKYDANGAYGYYTIYSEPREVGIQLAYRF